jgi:16S rRNA G966 N2-methylase RsmD
MKSIRRTTKRVLRPTTSRWQAALFNTIAAWAEYADGETHLDLMRGTFHTLCRPMARAPLPGRNEQVKIHPQLRKERRASLRIPAHNTSDLVTLGAKPTH